MQRNLKFTLAASVLALSQAIEVTQSTIDEDIPGDTECEREANRQIFAYRSQCETLEGLDNDGVQDCMNECEAWDADCAMACEMRMTRYQRAFCFRSAI